MAKKTPTAKDIAEAVKATDKRVCYCQIHNGTPHWLAYNSGNGPIRVYPDEENIDARLKLGDPEYRVVRTAEELLALCAEFKDVYDGGEFLVRLSAAKKAFPQYKYAG